MLNQTVLVGNIGNDPIEHYSQDGVPVTTFDLAFASSKKKTCWIKVTFFNKMAELCSRHLHKGARVGVMGLLDASRWTDKEGNSHITFQILGNSVEFIKTDGRGFSEGETTPETINDETPF